MIEDNIKAIAEKNRKIGQMEMIIEIQDKINEGWDAEDLWYWLGPKAEEIANDR